MKLDPSWCEPREGVDYIPDPEDPGWRLVHRTKKPKHDNFCVSGQHFGYHTNSESNRAEKVPFEDLSVTWLKKRGRARTGWLVRDQRTQEVIALVHQQNGWWWKFKLKYEYDNDVYRHWERDRDGWFWQTLAVCVSARIFTVVYEIPKE